MKKGSLVVGVLAFCFLFSLTMFTVAHAGDAVELKVGSHFPTKHPVVQEVFIPWGQTIEKRTNGRVKFTWFLDGSLVKAEQTLNAVKGGMVDIAAPLCIWAVEKQFPATTAIYLPFQLESEAHASQSFYEAYQQIPEIRQEFNGMKMLAFCSSGIANFHMKDILIKTIADFKGRRIWPGNSIGLQALKLWGASPTLVKLADIYMALQRGTLEGVIFPTPPLSDYRFTDIANSHTICGLTPGAQAVAMNQAKWDSLPPDIQKIFEELTLPLSIAVGRKFMDMNDFTISALKERGDKVNILTAEQKVEWKASLKPIYEAQIAAMNNAGLNGKSVMEKVQSVVENARKKPYRLDQNWKVVSK
jgi:TRAP-type C4-dicarboxylate transport system substrate-binding protein